ncbi:MULTISPECIES: hypothetical protein [Nitrosomonas]|uniref:Uncharacterized protein n=1 Tax=Nitrosomonas communis TaxID=44574 RepID=A0A0F7KC03_9PROT|nr:MULTISPECIES: hypothetical protein [Nitrosomonas]AKH38000.1 hypothetical protein AAW31_09535 [Nitrosomonas communis]TYP91611.1 hypothetical protein BCL69_100839 [Nitrosomonas communis]UVS59887.1 hypothetical protein NX761_10015 [Nitrosomonas sp. PLL12]
MNNKYLAHLLCFVLLIFSVTLPSYADKKNMDESNVASNMEELRDEITANKKLVVTNNMSLTDGEAKVFWPVYDAYQKDLHEINLRLARLIDDYAVAFNKGAIPNEKATQLIDEAIAIEMEEANLKRRYVPKLSAVLPGAKVARYLQIENKIRAIVRYELAESIPLVLAE